MTLSQEVTINKGIGNLMTYQIEKDSHDLLGYYDILHDENNANNIAADNECKERIRILCINLVTMLSAERVCIYLYKEENNNLSLYLSTDKQYARKKKTVPLGDKNFVKFTKQNVILNYDMLIELYKGDKKLKLYEIRYGNNILGIMSIYYKESSDIKVEMDELITSTCYKFGLLFQNRIIRNKLQKEKKQSLQYKQALEMEKLKTDFFAGISHEFRTPLNIIMAAVQLINSELDNSDFEKNKSKIKNNINYIRQNSNRLIKLVNNIIDVNKIDSGINKLVYVNCNIVEVVEDICMSVAEYIKSSSKNMVFDTEEEEIMTACDVDKIERVMLNLLSNAIKFGNNNSDILVNVKLNESKDSGGNAS